MSRVINTTNANKKIKDISLWLILFVFVGSLFLLSTIGLVAYQKKTDVLKTPVQHAQLEMQKQLILQQKDIINTNWLHTLNPLVKNVRGQLLWSNDKQKGMMEFSYLPKLKKGQTFQLFIFDLASSSSDPILAKLSNVDSLDKKSKTILIAFTPSEVIKEAFKFELLLKDDATEEAQPLLLAQP